MIVGRLEVKMRLRCGTKFGMNKCNSVTLKGSHAEPQRRRDFVIPTIYCVSIVRLVCYVKSKSLTLKVYNNTASFATSNDVLFFYIKNIKPL